MHYMDAAHRVAERVRRLFGLKPGVRDFGELSLSLADARPRLGDSSLETLFVNHKGRRVHKWIHYLAIYERYLKDYRETSVKMLEIGVNRGGSLEMWRQYLGDKAVIYGIDIDPACADLVSEPNQVRIGSQDDPVFLTSVVTEMGAPDIILDDGSHVGRHQRVSFDVLFPLLKDGGLYIIEDMHTAYWPGMYEGGHGRKGTAVEHIKTMIDDLHGWYHNRPGSTPARDRIGAIHVFDSITIIEKVGRKHAPAHVVVPS